VKKFKFKKIDAFATANSDGNPAGYIHLDSPADITHAEMQRIARELKGFVNEVGFIVQTGAADFMLKFFSSECEVDFCGHATIAIMYDLIGSNDRLKQSGTITVQTNRGTLPVKNRIPDEDAVYIMSPVPRFIPSTLNVDKISSALNLSNSAIDQSHPVSIINAGLTTLIIPIADIDSILRLSPDQYESKTFCLQAGIDIIEVFTGDVIDTRNNYRVRVFAPKFGYLEDPATGSGNSAFGYYLMHNNRFKGDVVSIEQNGDPHRFNIVKLRQEPDAENTMRILFGGCALKRIEGDYYLH
jgi:PhzF family phenazine biosynthesis protein